MQPTQPIPVFWEQAFENHRYRILFVDDKLFALNSVSSILRKAGYIVYTAQTYDKAIEILSTTHIHLGIFDLNLAGDAESPGDPEPQNYEGLDLATRDDFPLLRIIYTGNKDTDIVVTALKHPRVGDYILKGQDIEETLLKKVEVALTGSLHINQDLHFHQENISLQQIVQTTYPNLSIEQQMEHILELEDLFRLHFFGMGQGLFRQLSIKLLDTSKTGRVWLKVSAYSEQGRRYDSLVVCGERKLVMHESDSFDNLSPRAKHMRTNPVQTVHYAIRAYEVFEDSLHHIKTLAHYLHTGQDDIVANMMDSLHDERFQNRYRNTYTNETGTLYRLAGGMQDKRPWELTEPLFEISGRILDEWQQQIPGVRLYSQKNQLYYGEGHETQVYPHPIVHLETLCNQEVSRRIGITHGDLGLDSVFVNANNQEIYILDYADSNETSLLRDYVSLERSLHLELLSQITISNYQVLAGVLAGDDEDLPALSPETQRAVHHIRQIRQIAIRDTDCAPETYLQDLYLGFVTYLLSYPERAFVGQETLEKYAHCLLFAGQLCDDLQQMGFVALESVENGDGVRLDAEKYRVRVHGKSVDLTEKQFGLFEYLYSNIDQNCTYADIIEQGLHEEFLHDDIKLEKPRIQTAVSRLRPELKKFGFRIESWHNGYRLIRDGDGN